MINKGLIMVLECDQKGKEESACEKLETIMDCGMEMQH